MRLIPPKLRRELSNDPYMSKCARRHEMGCRGAIEWHHAIILKQQLNERWSLVPLCHFHHEGKQKNDELARHIAFQRATDEDLAKYPKANFKQEKEYLKKKYEV